MSTIVKSIATTIGMVVLLLSFAVVSPQIALGKGNKRAWSPARFQHANLSSRRLGPSSARLRSAASGSRSIMLLHGDFSSFPSNVRRTSPGFIDASNIYGSEGIRSRKTVRSRANF
jgi:hypothetical protein